MELFLKTFLAVIEIFLITTAGYFFFKINIFKRVYKALLFYTINIAIPVLILYRLATKFSASLLSQSILLPFYGLFLILLGYFVGKKAADVLKVKNYKMNIFIAMMMFTNCGYLPLPLFAALFKGYNIAIAQIYVFFITFIYISLIWSIGVNILRNDKKVKQGKFSFKITMPFLAVIVGVILAQLNIKNYISINVKLFMEYVGKSGEMLIMFIMGGGLSSVRIKNIKIDKTILFLTLFRLIILPLTILPVIIFLKLDFILRAVLLVEAGVPPAVNIVIINQQYGKSKDLDFIMSSMIINYIFAIITIPLLIFIAQIL